MSNAAAGTVVRRMTALGRMLPLGQWLQWVESGRCVISLQLICINADSRALLDKCGK